MYLTDMPIEFSTISIAIVVAIAWRVGSCLGGEDGGVLLKVRDVLWFAEKFLSVSVANHFFPTHAYATNIATTCNVCNGR